MKKKQIKPLSSAYNRIDEQTISSNEYHNSTDISEKKKPNRNKVRESKSINNEKHGMNFTFIDLNELLFSNLH